MDENNYDGILNIDLYYDTEDNNGILEKSIDIPFIIKNVKNNYDFYIDYCEIKSNNGEYICTFRIKSVEDVVFKNISILKDCELSNCEQNDNYPMTIYFVKPNDTLWNIAKEFKVSVESLIALNNLNPANEITTGEKIYIMRG